MGFVVDKVSEDSFYENLLLGVSKILEKCPCVSNLNLERASGCKQIDIRNWEHNNGVILPEDLRAFYSSTNGFSYTYNFTYDYHASEDARRLIRTGRIEINPLELLVRTFGYETKNVAEIQKLGNGFCVALSRDSKLFELANVEDYGKVVLVYINSYSTPSIWLFNSPTCNYLAENFTAYFRMCIAHVGIPCWQCFVTKEGLPEWSREMFQLIAPGILHDESNQVTCAKLNIENVNKIDSNIFVVPSSVSNNVVVVSEPAATALPTSAKFKSGDKRVKTGFRRSFVAGRGKRH